MKRMLSNKITKFCVALLAFAFIMCIGSANVTKAADDVMYVTPSTTDVIAGKEFTITLSMTHASGISAAMLNLNYDASMVTYVSGADGSGYAGVIPLNYMEASDTTKVQWVIKFKATKTGTCNFSVTNGVVYSSDEEELNVTYNKASVKIWAQGSDDATLKSLEVGGHSLSPAFAKWTVNYTVKVPTTTTSVTVSALSTQGGRVEIKGNYTNLAYGNNVVTITSYAPNGKTMKYTVTIVRPEPVTEPVTEPTTAPPAWSEVVVEGITYNINSDYSKNIIPAGFEPTVYDYKGNGVLASYSGKNGLNLLYLVDAEKKGKFFIYDGKEDKFYPFITLSSVGNQYIILPGSMQEEAPDNCTMGVLEIGDYSIDGYINNVDEEFGYFYAVNQDGYKGWYCYDITEKTIQRMDVMDVEEETEPVETPSEEETQPSSSENDYSSENESLRAENALLIKIRNIAVPVAAVLAVVLIGLIIFLLAHKSEKEHAIPGGDVDYVKMEKELDKEPDVATDDEDISMYEEAIMNQFAATQVMEPVAETVVVSTAEAPSVEAAEVTETVEDEAVITPVSLTEEEEFDKEADEIPDGRMDIEKEIISLDDEEDFL